MPDSGAAGLYQHDTEISLQVHSYDTSDLDRIAVCGASWSYHIHLRRVLSDYALYISAFAHPAHISTGYHIQDGNSTFFREKSIVF